MSDQLTELTSRGVSIWLNDLSRERRVATRDRLGEDGRICRHAHDVIIGHEAGQAAAGESVLLAAVGRPAGGRRTRPAPAVGLDLGQGSGLSRYPLRGRSGGTRGGQYDARVDLARGGNHGQVPADSIPEHYDEARQVLDQLKAVGVDYDDVTADLETEGVAKFDASWQEVGDQVTAALQRQSTRQESGE